MLAELNNSVIRQEIIDFKKNLHTETVFKALIALAVLVSGIALIIFLHMADCMAIGIGLICVASIAICLCYKEWRQTSRFFQHSADAVAK